jgi:DNA-binding transcriptional MerR regulator
MLKAKANSSEEFLMTSDAARRLEVSSQRIIQLEREGKLPAIRAANGTRLFRAADIERLRQEREEKRGAML